jgi:hypothetical protein
MSQGVKRFNPVIRPTTRDDCIQLAKALRKADLEEISHASGLNPDQTLLYSLAVSDECYTVWIEDEIVLIFGCGGVADRWGVPWMMASDLLLQIKREFVKECRRIVQAMLERYGHLENYVWSGNKIHIYWLEWLGFKIEPPVPFGINNEPFHRFYMTR